MWVNVCFGAVNYAYQHIGKAALASSRQTTFSSDHKKEINKAEILLASLIDILKQSSDKIMSTACREAVSSGFWSELSAHQDTQFLDEYRKEMHGRYNPPKADREAYAVMIAATKLIIRYAVYKDGANRPVDLLKGTIIGDDPKSERYMLMSAYDTVQKSDVFELIDGHGPYEVNQIAAEKNLKTEWIVDPHKQFIVDFANIMLLRCSGVISDHQQKLIAVVAKNLGDHFRETKYREDGKLPKDIFAAPDLPAKIQRQLSTKWRSAP